MERLFLEFSNGMALHWRAWHSPLQSANFVQLDTPPRSSRACGNIFGNRLSDSISTMLGFSAPYAVAGRHIAIFFAKVPTPDKKHTCIHR